MKFGRKFNVGKALMSYHLWKEGPNTTVQYGNHQSLVATEHLKCSQYGL